MTRAQEGWSVTSVSPPNEWMAGRRTIYWRAWCVVCVADRFEEK